MIIFFFFVRTLLKIEIIVLLKFIFCIYKSDVYKDKFRFLVEILFYGNIIKVWKYIDSFRLNFLFIELFLFR